MAKDLYAILGVPRSADADAIKKAYRKLAMKYHPDKNPGKDAEARFKEINQANDVLGDAKKKSAYDEFGEESLQQGFDPERARMMKNFGRQRGGRGAPGGFDFFQGGQGGPGGPGGGGVDMSDLFGDLFGQRGGGRRAPARAPDHEANVTIDFASALRGTTVSLSPPDGGTPVTIRIPAGVVDGGRVKVEGQGGAAPGAARGDLFIVVHVEPHPHFRRDGDDLHLDLPISLVEAYQGAKVKVPTPEGEVALKVPPKTQSGQVLRLRGKGVARKNRPAGDLYVKFLVRIPDSSDPAVEKAIEALAPFVDVSARDDIRL